MAFIAFVGLYQVIGIPINAQVLPGVLPFSTNDNGVDVATGNINLAFPLRSKTGKVPFWSKVVGTSGISVGSSGTAFGPMFWSYQDPTSAVFYSDVAATGQGSCPAGTDRAYYYEDLTDFSVTDSTGAAHQFPQLLKYHVGNGQTGTVCGPPQAALGPVQSIDNSGYTMTITSGVLVVYDRSGNQWNGTCSYDGGCTLAPAFSDADGASISYSTATTPAQSGPITVTDTLNTTVLSGVQAYTGSPVLSSLTSPAVTYTDSTGHSQQYAFGYTALNLASNFGCVNSAGVQSPADYSPTVSSGFSNMQMLTSITMPGASPAAYGITYEPTPGQSSSYTGRVASITLPTGGSVTYAYSGGSNGINCTYGTVPTLTVTVNDANGHSSVYTYVNSLSTAPAASSSAPGPHTVTKTDPAGNQTVYSFIGELQTQVQYFQGQASGTPIKTISTCYDGNLSNCAAADSVPAFPLTQMDVYTSYGTSNSSLVETLYDVYGNVTSTKEMDFGNVGSNGQCLSAAAGVCRLTTTTYGSWNGSSCSSLGMIHNTPCDVKITNNNTGALASETRTTYNSSGHPTVVSRWVSGSTWLTTTNVYNGNGTLASMTDPANNTTSYRYDGSGGCNNLLLTSTAYPVSSAGSTSQTWDCNGGVLVSQTEANAQTTSFTYNDPAWRLTNAGYPDGGSTSTVYNTGSATPWSITTSTLLNGSSSLVREIDYDGLGRTIESRLTSDPSGTDVTDTTYDSLGNVYTVSNPHRSGSSQTDGTTTNIYDALGRLVRTTEADGSSTVQRCYQGVASQSGIANCSSHVGTSQGSWVDYTDELGHHAQRTSNSAGNLTTVFEPDASNNPTLETDYTYDILNDLVQVDQWGGPSGAGNTTACLLPSGASASGAACERQRLFVYDGLSRLTSATNPESGLISYTYDATGNLHTKTDARGSMTTYGYDGLNRLKSKMYSDITPPVSYTYDVPVQNWNFINQTTPSWTGVSQTYLAGRLSYESNSNSTIVYGYDPVGRTKLKSVCTPSTCGSDHYDMHVTYDLAGNPTFADRGLDAVRNAASPNSGYYYGGLSMLYNAASQLTSANGDIVDAQHPQSILNALNYTPLGGVATVELGAQYGQVSQYDKRGHMTDRSSVNLSGYTVLSDHWDYDAANNLSDTNDSAQGQFTYQYDTLNRVTNGSSSQFTTTYGYDNWGNQTSHVVTAGSSFQWSFMPNTRNQATLSGSSYDAAGNMTSDGLHNYTYDAEGRLSGVTDQAVQYSYDPEGMRVATVTSGSVTAEYLYDLSGNIVSTLTNTGQLVRSVLRASDLHWGDYIGSAGAGGVRTEFRLVNQVGTLVANGDTQGNFIEGCLSGPFGDGQMCTPSYDYTETHFTDKLRDQESNNDYFGARYFNSTLGRWVAPDVVNVTEDRLNSPTNTLNKYVYGANNPLEYVDPDGKDITIFYQSPSLSPFSVGHTILLSYNQETQDYGVESFGPDYAHGSTAVAAATGTPGVDTFDFSNFTSADQLKAKFASLTIQTTPDEAQQVINAIRTHPGGSYNVLFKNCTTICSKLLKSIGKTWSLARTPSAFFQDLYDEQHHNGLPSVDEPWFLAGHEYGFPRQGYDPFALLFADFQQFQHERVTITIIDGTQEVNQSPN